MGSMSRRWTGMARGGLRLLVLCHLAAVAQMAHAAMAVSRSEGVQIITTRRPPVPQAEAGRQEAPEPPPPPPPSGPAPLAGTVAGDERELVKRALAEEQRGMHEAIADYARASKAGSGPETLAPLEREVRARLQKIDMLLKAPQ